MFQDVESTSKTDASQHSEAQENAYEVLCSFLGAHTGEECERMIDERLVPNFK